MLDVFIPYGKVVGGVYNVLSCFTRSEPPLVPGHKGWYHYTKDPLRTYGWVESRTEVETQSVIEGLRI